MPLDERRAPTYALAAGISLWVRPPASRGREETCGGLTTAPCCPRVAWLPPQDGPAVATAITSISQAETEARKVLGPARGHAVCDGAGTRTRASQVPGRIRRPLSEERSRAPAPPAPSTWGGRAPGESPPRGPPGPGPGLSRRGLSDAEEREVQALKRVQRTAASTLARGWALR